MPTPRPLRLASLSFAAAMAAAAPAHATPEYATWLGGSQSAEVAFGVATGATGDVYVAGRTLSPSFPFTPGGPITPVFAPSPQSQPFVARLDPAVAGTPGLVFADFLGGTAGDGGGEARAVAVDGAGNVYVVGFHTGWTMPVVGGFAQHPTDHNNGFLVKLSPDGHTILYSTYIGGNANLDLVEDLVVDDSGVATLVGHTASYDFPTKAGFAGAPQNGLFDAFAMRIDTTKTGAASLVWSTCYGGSGDDLARSVAVDGAGRVVIAGTSNSYAPAGKLPMVARSFQTNNGGGGDDAFVAVLDPTIAGADALRYATYLGGPYTEEGGAVDVDATGRIYVTGATMSPTFPTTPGVHDTTVDQTFGPGTRTDAFLVALDPSAALPAQTLVWSTVFGASQNEYAWDLEVDAAGRPVIAGQAGSLELPLLGCSLPRDAATTAYVARFTTSGQLDASQVFGGGGNERADGLALLPGGHLVLAGTSSSPTLPVTASAYQASKPGGGDDVFVAVLWDCMTCPPGMEVAGIVCAPCPPGSASPDGVACRECADGTMAPNAGSASCVACGCGSASSADHTACDLCPAGTYSADGTSCDVCPAGGVSSLGACACLACPAGTQPGVDGSTCEPCPAGTASADGVACVACAPGLVAASGAASCTACGCGSEPTVDASACASCGAGSASADGLDCSACQAGAVASAGACGCTACAPGSEPDAVQGACAACTAGSYSADGAACLACPPGTTSAAGATTCVAACAGNQLAALVSPGLSPAFAPGVTQYGVPATASGSTWIEATLCDPSLTLYVGGNQVASGAKVGAWTGNGQVSISLYSGWTKVGQYTLTVDPALPPAPLTEGLASLTTPGLAPGFAPAIAGYTAPVQPGWVTPVTATVTSPAYTLYVDGMLVASGTTFNAWAPPGSTIDVSVYWGWILLGDYDVVVTP